MNVSKGVGMRFLTILVVSVGLLYSGYWFVGATAVERGAQSALAELQADNWTVNVADVSTRGFPSRFDTTLTDLELGTPDGSLIYRAPFLQAFALSYAPNEVIVAFANDQRLDLAGQTIEIASQALRASASVEPNTRATLETLTAEMGPIAVTSSFGWDTALSKGLAAMRRVAGEGSTYDLFADFADIALPREIAAQIENATGLPNAFQSVTFDAQAEIDRTLDRFVMLDPGKTPPRPKTLDIRGFNAQWGDTSISAMGELVFDDVGVSSGALEITAVAWDPVINALVVSERIEPDVAQTIRNVLSSMSQGKTTLTVPISFRNGLSFIGPIPIGPAPKF